MMDRLQTPTTTVMWNIIIYTVGVGAGRHRHLHAMRAHTDTHRQSSAGGTG